MKKCYNCGNILGDADMFCEKCGANVGNANGNSNINFQGNNINGNSNIDYNNVKGAHDYETVKTSKGIYICNALLGVVMAAMLAIAVFANMKGSSSKDYLNDDYNQLKENIEKADKLAKAKNELNELKITLEKENKQQYVAEKIKLINDKALNESMLRNKRQELDERQLKIEQDSKRKNELYKKWDEISNTKLEFDPDSFVCPTCKREYETEKIEEIKKQFENNFNNHKKVEQNAINTEGQAINSRIKENTETIEKIKMEMADIDTKLNETKVKIENIENEEAKNATIDVTAFPKYQEKLKEVNELQEIVDKLINGDTSEIQGRKNNIIDLINNIDKQLNERAIQERTKERIKELENEEENIANKVQELEAQQYQIEQFTKTKVELLESAINSKFEVVKFRLFDTQINGGLVECCDTLVKGVPYSDVNNAHKILAGLDIINTLIKFYQTSAPIFIDNRESINELYNINAQIISLIVTTDSQLRIEVI